MDQHSVLNMFSTTRVLLLFVVYEFTTCAFKQVSAASQEEKKNDEEGDMVKGLAIGLGGFFALVIFLCLLWKCCCSHDDSSGSLCSCCPDRQKSNDPKDMKGRRRMTDHGSKVSPSPPSSVMSWSRNS